MDLLKNVLLDSCGDELDELGGCVVSMFRDSENFPFIVEDTYGVPADLITDGFIIDDTSGSHFELVVLRTPDQDSALEVMNIFSDYSRSLRKNFSSTQLRIDAMNHVLCGATDTFSFFLFCENSEDAQEKLTTAIWAKLLPAEQSAEPPQPTVQPVEIADGFFFLNVSSSEVDGEPDPSHPGRARYIQPSKDDMSIYDASAIVAAWAANNPERLSAYDRAIYDRAKNVLGGILLDGMDDFSKEAAIYEWILQNVEYDWSHTDVMAETPKESFTPYGGLVNRKAVCLGYAGTFQLLMELAGVECITVVGAFSSSQEDHAWNMVRLNGEWYCVDTTWDWPYRNDTVMDGRVWRYFNVTSDYMARTNHQWDYDNVPEATAEDHGCS